MKFIGMDAHSRTCTFVVLGKSGKILRRAKVQTQENELLGFVRSVKGHKKLTFEEGVMSQRRSGVRSQSQGSGTDS